MADHWQLNPCVVLHWRQIDGEWLVYEDLSGSTHMIDHLSAAVLACFESRAPLTMPDLLAQLASDLALDVTAEQLSVVLQPLCTLGLLLHSPDPTHLHAAA